MTKVVVKDIGSNYLVKYTAETVDGKLRSITFTTIGLDLDVVSFDYYFPLDKRKKLRGSNLVHSISLVDGELQMMLGSGYLNQLKDDEIRTPLFKAKNKCMSVMENLVRDANLYTVNLSQHLAGRWMGKSLKVRAALHEKDHERVGRLLQKRYTKFHEIANATESKLLQYIEHASASRDEWRLVRGPQIYSKRRRH